MAGLGAPQLPGLRAVEVVGALVAIQAQAEPEVTPKQATGWRGLPALAAVAEVAVAADQAIHQ